MPSNYQVQIVIYVYYYKSLKNIALWYVCNYAFIEVSDLYLKYVNK